MIQCLLLNVASAALSFTNMINEGVPPLMATLKQNNCSKCHSSTPITTYSECVKTSFIE